MVEVKNSLGQRYNASIKVLVSRLQPLVYQPGMTVPVLIDPKDENKMVIDVNNTGRQNTSTDNYQSKSLSAIQEIELKEALMKDQLQGDAIMLTGRPARALVKKFSLLGANINGNNPYAQIEIEVLPADAPAFAATVKGVIKEASVAKYQPGEEIFVKYDAYDLTKVVLDHS